MRGLSLQVSLTAHQEIHLHLERKVHILWSRRKRVMKNQRVKPWISPAKGHGDSGINFTWASASLQVGSKPERELNPSIIWFWQHLKWSLITVFQLLIFSFNRKYFLQGVGINFCDLHCSWLVHLQRILQFHCFSKSSIPASHFVHLNQSLLISSRESQGYTTQQQLPWHWTLAFKTISKSLHKTRSRNLTSSQATSLKAAR